MGVLENIPRKHRWGGFTITPTAIGGTEDSVDAWVEISVVKHSLKETAKKNT